MNVLDLCNTAKTLITEPENNPEYTRGIVEFIELLIPGSATLDVAERCELIKNLISSQPNSKEEKELISQLPSADIFKQLIAEHEKAEAEKERSTPVEVGDELAANLTRIGNGFYIVRTQAGFNRLCELTRARSERDTSRPITGYPESYPCLVTVEELYYGYHYLQARSIHLNVLTKAIKENDGGH